MVILPVLHGIRCEFSPLCVPSPSVCVSFGHMHHLSRLILFGSMGDNDGDQNALTLATAAQAQL